MDRTKRSIKDETINSTNWKFIVIRESRSFIKFTFILTLYDRKIHKNWMWPTQRPLREIHTIVI